MKFRYSTTIAILISVVFLSPAFSQSGRQRRIPADPNDDKTQPQIRLTAEEVLLPARLHSDDGRIPDDLKKSDFIVSEGGKRMEVTAVMQSPANYLIVLDAGGHIYKNVLTNCEIPKEGRVETRAKDFEKKNSVMELARSLINQIGKYEKVALLTYAENPKLICPWTSNKEELLTALEWKYKPGVESNLPDCLEYAVKEILPQVSGRKSLVLISDGLNSSSEERFVDAVDALLRARVMVHIVSTTAIQLAILRPMAFNSISWYEKMIGRIEDGKWKSKVGEYQKYVRLLEFGEGRLIDLSDATGGMMWNPVTCDEIRSLAPKITQLVGRECVLSYIVDRKPGDIEEREIRIYSTRPGLQVYSLKRIFPNSGQ
jgi:VWFA-related protein